MSSGTIVVGVDGSAGAELALQWAAGEARLRDARLRIVHAWTIPLSVGMPEPSVLGLPIVHESSLEDIGAAFSAEGQRVLDEASASLEGVEIEQVLVEDTPARALVHAASDADLLVVGSRGRGGFKGLLLGSVSQQCAHHAPCPLVIVPDGLEV